MKVLFVGDGRHDIGDAGTLEEPAIATGVVPTLARKVSPSIAHDSLALRWTDIPRLTKRGYAAKVRAAVMVAQLRHQCVATICVVDRDRDASRERALQQGVAEARQSIGYDAVAGGVAVQTIEAWTLGAPDAIAAELGIDRRRVEAELPAGSVESLVDGSGNPEHQSKPLLRRIAALGNRVPDTAFRVAVAERTDIASLVKACPDGFAPFVDAVRALCG